MFLENIKQACEIYPGIEKIIVMGDVGEGGPNIIPFIELALMDDGALYGTNRDDFDPVEDIAVMPYSSGTTGPPKGVALTHYNLVANMVQILHPDVKMVSKTTTERQEVTIAVLPFFHIYAMNTIMTLGLHLGTKTVTVPKFEPELYLRALSTYKPTYLALVPPLVR